MNYKQHLTINITIFLIFFLILNVLGFFSFNIINIKNFNSFSFEFKNFLLYFFITIFLTLLPDIDSKKSIITKIFFSFYIILFSFGMYYFFKYNFFKATILVFSSIFLFFLHYYFSKNNKFHRSFSHSLIFGFIVTFILALIFFDFKILYLYIFFILHLIEDKNFFKSLKKDFYFIKKILK